MASENVLDHQRVQEILQGLTKGLTRDELAHQYGHSSYKSIDIYMRRKGFEWDKETGNYRLRQAEKEVAHVDTSKAARIVQLIAQEEQVDLKRIAQLMHFQSDKELAAYMASHHYKWCPEKNNYVKELITVVEVAPSPVATLSDSMFVEDEDDEELAIYVPLLKMLKANELKLLNLLQPYGAEGKIPRYTIPGVAKTKTVQMIHSLDQMVTEFAREKNMTQRDVFEVALIDFFKRYGYEKQVEVLLK